MVTRRGLFEHEPWRIRRRDHARLDAERQAHHRRDRVTGRKTEHHGTAKPDHAVPDDIAHRDLSARLVAFRKLPEHDRGGAIHPAAQPQLHEHAMNSVRALADLVEEQHVAVRRLEGVGRLERAQQLRERAARKRPDRDARLQRLEACVRLVAQRLGLRLRRNDAGSYASGPCARRPSTMAPCTDARPTMAPRKLWSDVTSL